MDARISIAIFAIIAYCFWPAPKLSDRLLEWREGGQEFKYQHKHIIFYRDEQGFGPDDEILVLIHGFPTSSFDWLKVLDGLKTRFGRIIAPDMLGFGFSDKPGDHEYSIFEQADIIVDLLQYLKVDSVHLLSHDYGDTVAQEILHRHSKDKDDEFVKIKSICLLNGGVFPHIHTRLWAHKALLHPVMQKFMPYINNYWIFSSQLSSTFGVNKPTDEDLNEWWALTLHKHGQFALPKLINYVPQRLQHKARWLEALQNTPAKVHFVYGPEDPVNPHPFEETFKSHIPRGTIDTLPDVGHYVQWEAPEMMLNSYFKFLKENKFH